MSNNESFVRWQGRTLQQLGSVINLFLGLGLALLAYLTNLLTSSEFKLDCWGELLYILALLTTGISIGTGVITTINRLRDFKVTTRIARRRGKGVENDALKNDRDKVKKLGNRTWTFFYWQIGSFLLSVILVIILFIKVYL